MIEKNKLKQIEEKLKIIEEYEEFRGYPNYQTWCVANWLKQDKNQFEKIRLWMDKGQGDIYWLGDMIKNHIENSNPIAASEDLYCLILDFSLARVEYYFIADKFINENKS